jgi:hypothetical protein
MIVFTNDTTFGFFSSQPLTVISMISVPHSHSIPHLSVLHTSYGLTFPDCYGNVGTIGDYIYHVSTRDHLKVNTKPGRTIQYHIDSGTQPEMAPMNEPITTDASISCVINDRFYVGGIICILFPPCVLVSRIFFT